jgi:hypothetical protein
VNVAAHGLQIEAPDGWEARIYRRPLDPKEPNTRFPIVHAANFALPSDPGDFGSGAVRVMGTGGVFIALLEYGPAYRGQRKFRIVQAPPQVEATEFAYNTVQIFVAGQLGLQQFFEFKAHTFCLYVVVGSLDAIGVVLPLVNELVGSLTFT